MGISRVSTPTMLMTQTENLRSAQPMQDYWERLISAGYVPGRKPRREAKALDAGLRIEAAIVAKTHDVYGAICWRNPGVSSLKRVTGDGYRPDAVGVLPLLHRYTAYQEADTPGKPAYNFIMSVKSQNTSGSAKQKILTEISDLAAVCDSTEIVAVVVMQGKYLDDGLVAAAKRQGKRDMVAVITEDELLQGTLVAELLTVAKRRQQLRRKLGPRGGLPPAKRRTEQDWAYANRRAAQQAATRALKTAVLSDVRM